MTNNGTQDAVEPFITEVCANFGRFVRRPELMYKSSPNVYRKTSPYPTIPTYACLKGVRDWRLRGNGHIKDCQVVPGDMALLESIGSVTWAAEHQEQGS